MTPNIDIRYLVLYYNIILFWPSDEILCAFILREKNVYKGISEKLIILRAIAIFSDSKPKMVK